MPTGGNAGGSLCFSAGLRSFILSKGLEPGRIASLSKGYLLLCSPSSSTCRGALRKTPETSGEGVPAGEPHGPLAGSSGPGIGRLGSPCELGSGVRPPPRFSGCHPHGPAPRPAHTKAPRPPPSAARTASATLCPAPALQRAESRRRQPDSGLPFSSLTLGELRLDSAPRGAFR